MKRLRYRLVAAFLGVSLLATIVIAVVPYYTLVYKSHQFRTQSLNYTADKLYQDIDMEGQEIQDKVLNPFARYIQDRFPKDPDLIENLETAEETDDYVIENSFATPIYSFTVDYLPPKSKWASLLLTNLEVIPRKKHLEMKSWMDRENFYEENGQIYWWRFKPLFKGESKENIEIIGGLFVKQPLIRKNLDNPDSPPDLFVRYGWRMFAIHPQPSMIEKYLHPDTFNRLFGRKEEGLFEEVNVDRIEIDPDDDRWPNNVKTSPMQIKFIPIVNQRQELTSIIVMALPINNFLEIIGFPLLVGYLVTLFVIVVSAALFARTIARPIRELASASHRMSEGEFETRVSVAGTEEQQLLSSSFNLMASRIQLQIEQLHQKTQELETSNLELGRIQRFLESLLANIRTGVMSIEPDGRISHINRVGVNMLDLSEWHGKRVQDVITESVPLNLILSSLKMKLPVAQNEIPYRIKDGTVLSLQVGTEPLLESDELTRLVVTFHDLTPIRKLEEQVNRQDRLAALGRMAAGVAHEIRNPLGIIQGSAELLNKRFGESESEEGLTDFILDEVKRLSRVVTDFLMLARPPVPSVEELVVQELFDQVVSYLHNQQNANDYPVSIDIEADIPSISADPDMCRQVFLNLLLNAQDAMPDGGSVTLRARRFSNTEVVLELADEGQGIHPDAVDKIFDPFYTSKDTGTGLGLSLVQQVISSHGGRVEVESALGRGSVFRLYFPVHEAKPRSASFNAMA